MREIQGRWPQWHLWLNGRTPHARWLGSSPPAVLGAVTWEGLGQRIAAYDAAWAATHSYRAAMAAAHQVEEP